MNKKAYGFTIVELLIVIVVVGILAAISIVAYNGIQNRASDASVQNDLTNLAKAYEMYKVDNGNYPYGSSLNSGSQVKMRVARNAYDLSRDYQLANCTSSTLPGTNYALLAVSKSGKRFYTSSSSGGAKEYTGADSWSSLLAACPNVLAGSGANGAGYDNGGGWRSWILS